jgi:tetratricopeptide (TPR) repeat protein
MPGKRRKSRRKTPEQLALTRKLHLIGLSLLVVLVFASSLLGSFVWTDHDDILKGGYRITSLDDLHAVVTTTRDAYRLRIDGASADPTSGNWQPVVALSNSLSWGIWGECAFCFHLENLLLHLLTVIGVYALARHLLAQRRHGHRIALWSAALFAVHPATVTSVAWIGGRSYLLAGVFAVWSLVLFTRLQATTKSQREHTRRWLVLSTLTAMAAYLSNEMTFVLPLAAFMVAAFESRERGRHFAGGISPLRLQGIALISGALLLVLLYRSFVIGGIQAAGDYPSASTLDNIGTALRHFWYLFESAAVPGEPVLSDAWKISHGWGSTEVAALLGMLVLLVLIGLGLRINHPSAFGVAWFVIWIVPGAGFFPSDHYHNPHALYLASWGLALAFGYGLFVLWRPLGRQLLPGSEAVVYAPLILVLGVMTALSNARWWDNSGLFEAEIAHDPYYIEGRLELADVALTKGDAEAALNHVLTAIEAARNDAYTGYWSPRDGFLLLGRAQRDLGLYHESAGSLKLALEERPGDARVLYHLGVTHIALDEHEEAETALREALRSQPELSEARADLGVAFSGQGRFADAEPLLREAIAQGKGNQRRHRALALSLIERGDLAAAAEQLEAALMIKETVDERARLAWISWRLGNTDKAYQDLNMAMQMEETMSPYLEWVQQQFNAIESTEQPGDSDPQGDTSPN